MLLPIVSQIINKVSELTQWWSRLGSGTKTVIMYAAGVVAALGPVVGLFGNLTRVVGFAAPAFQMFARTIGLTTAVQDAMAASSVALTSFLAGEATAGEAATFALSGMSGLLGPLAIAAGIAAGAYAIFSSRTDELKQAQDNLAASIQNVNSAMDAAAGAKIGVAEAKSNRAGALLQVIADEKHLHHLMVAGKGTVLERRQAEQQLRQDRIALSRATLQITAAEEANQKARETAAEAIQHQARMLHHLNTVTKQSVAVRLHMLSPQKYQELADKYAKVATQTQHWLDKNSKLFPGLANTVRKTHDAAQAAEQHYRALGHTADGASKAKDKVGALADVLKSLPKNIQVRVNVSASITETLVKTVATALGSSQSWSGPKHDTGGLVLMDHVAMVHAGELITPYKDVVAGAGRRAGGHGSLTLQSTTNLTLDSALVARSTRKQAFRDAENGNYWG
jgi:uncharacterized phage infection (PIP) family protein YhgE